MSKNARQVGVTSSISESVTLIILLSSVVLDTWFWQPWFSKHHVLESGAIKLLKTKEHYLRVVCQSPSSLVCNQGVGTQGRHHCDGTTQ